LTPFAAAEAALVAASAARAQVDRVSVDFLWLRTTAATLTTTIAPTTHFMNLLS
jgi:hypothetical protein